MEQRGQKMVILVAGRGSTAIVAIFAPIRRPRRCWYESEGDW